MSQEQVRAFEAKLDHILSKFTQSDQVRILQRALDQIITKKNLATQPEQAAASVSVSVSDVIATVRERYRGTKWGKAAECICDAVDEAIIAQRPAQPAASVSDEREAFEAWYFENVNRAELPDYLPTLETYSSATVANLFCAWKARAALRPAQAGVPDDIVKNAQRYRWLRRKACVIGKTTYCGEETGQPILDFVNLPDVTEVISRDSATTLDAAIDAAQEREACAKVSEAQIERWVDDRARYAASECAAAIRARSKT